MILGDIVIAMIIEATARILQVLDMPVPLIQSVIDHLLILVHNTYAQKQEGCHEKGISPCLLREIVICRYGMLQYMIPKS